MVAAQETRKEIVVRDLLDAGLHFGHQTKRWNPKMKRYIFGKRNGIHIIDLSQSLLKLKQALEFVREIVVSGKSVLFVGTKKQAQEIIKEAATNCGQHYVTHRWLGGTLTNSATIRRSVARMQELEKMEKADNFGTLHKKEASSLRHELEKLSRNLSGIANMKELPGALFVVDIAREAIAVKEAIKLGVPVVAIVDTNCDPDPIRYIIPGNDDALRAVKLIATAVAETAKDAAAEYAKVAAEIAKKREADRAAAEAKRAAEKAAREVAAAAAGKEAEVKAKASRKAAKDAKDAKDVKDAKDAKAAKATKEAKETAEAAATAATPEEEAKPVKKAATPIVPDRTISAIAGTRAAELIVDEDASPEAVDMVKGKMDLRKPTRKHAEKDKDHAE